MRFLLLCLVSALVACPAAPDRAPQEGGAGDAAAGAGQTGAASNATGSGPGGPGAAALEPIDLSQATPAEAARHWIRQIALRGESFPEARAALNELAADHPQDPGVQLGLGVAAFYAGELGEAEELLRATLRLAPDDAEAHLTLGQVLVAQGRPDAGRNAFIAATEADPMLIDAWYNLGQLRYLGGNMEEALRCWREARRLAPDDFQLAKKELQALYALRLWDEAAAARTALLELRASSSDPNVRQIPEFVYDQFGVGGEWIYAVEVIDKELAPDPAAVAVGYRFDCTRNDQLIRRIQLEASHATREAGIEWIVSVLTPQGHTTTQVGFETLPSYEDLRVEIALLLAQIQEQDRLTAEQAAGGAPGAPPTAP